MKPYVVLGTYKPEVWKASSVGKHITAMTKKAGLIPHVDPAHGPLPLKGKNWVDMILHAEVRRRTFNTMQAEGWHYDGDTTPNAKPDCGMVLWASNSPTEIQFEGKVYVPKPYEVVLFLNKACLHRRPAGVPKMRWVFRQRVAKPTWGDFPSLFA